MPQPSPSPMARLYFKAVNGCARLLTLLQAAFNGFWLGILPPKALKEITVEFFQKKIETFSDPVYNRQGFFPWEEIFVSQHLTPGGKVLVAAAGGGREMLALSRRGFTVEGFDCAPLLVETANRLFKEENLAVRVRLAPPDICPPFQEKFDAIIVGWSSYGLIPERKKRIDYLRELQSLAHPGAPILLSFAVKKSPSLAVTRVIANFFRFILRRDRVLQGDSLRPHFEHYFIQEELKKELAEAGFRLERFDTQDYPHAFARRVSHELQKV